jgi:nucleoside-diphosphate-sugar epimerase
MKRILVLGSDGYIGWPLTIDLLSNDYEVATLDNYSRRKRVKEINSNSLTPIHSPSFRRSILKSYPKFIDENGQFNLHSNPSYILSYLKEIKPDTIIHLAEQPSAPWSMIGVEQANETQQENVIGTMNLLWAMKEVCPSAHLIKLGTMGEYGTPPCNIPEGDIPQDCLNFEQSNPCPMAGLPFPRSPGSFYHLSKVHDTHNIIFACKTWGLTSTDIMQGIVYGITVTAKQLITRFDYDEYFGTVINRFIAQAICGHPLTIYGGGNQTRGFLPLTDSIKCIKLSIENPPFQGTYRVFNQYAQIYSINELAEIIYRISYLSTGSCAILHLDNPRVEQEVHEYFTTNQGLKNLGYVPNNSMYQNLKDLFTSLYQYRDKVNQDVIIPKTKWRDSKCQV